MTGNIGEQLFKYAAARNFALIYNVDLLIDVTWFIKNKKNKLEPNKIALTDFNTIFGMAGSVIINNFLRTKQKYYLNRFPEAAKYKVVVENKKEFSNALYITNPPFYMIGDYRSEKYFEENIEQIRDELTVSFTSIKKLTHLIKRIENVNSVAVFIQSKVVSKNNILNNFDIDWSYYQKAINHLEGIISNLHFIFFTDLEYDVLKQLEFVSSYETISLYQNEFESRNVYLMSKCRYLIANSSATSWWAAWLNFTADRTVIIPQNFSFEYPEITHNKLGIQQNWIKI